MAMVVYACYTHVRRSTSSFLITNHHHHQPSPTTPKHQQTTTTTDDFPPTNQLTTTTTTANNNNHPSPPPTTTTTITHHLKSANKPTNHHHHRRQQSPITHHPYVRYDRFGEAGVEGRGFAGGPQFVDDFDIGDIFDSFFGGAFLFLFLSFFLGVCASVHMVKGGGWIGGRM
jgi:hypothetical protein